MSKALIINGSPRIHGNTAWLSSRVFDGLHKRGIESVPVIAAKLCGTNTGCVGCNGCQSSDIFCCVFKDDIQPLVASMPSYQYVIFATPVYFFGPTAQIKMVTDRMFSLLKSSDDGTFRHPFAASTKFGLIVTSGGPESDGTDLVVSTFKRIADTFGRSLETLLMPTAPLLPEQITDTTPYEHQVEQFCRALTGK